MEHNENLARLEQYVEKLIDSHNQLKNKNSEIYAQLQAKHQEIADLQEMVKNLQEDRSEMHNRVTGLLDRIDEWEKTFDQEEQKKKSKSGKNKTKSLSKKSSPLFNVASEQSSEPALR